MVRLLLRVVFCLSLLSTASCALSTAPHTETEPPVPPPPVPAPDIGCAFVDFPGEGPAEGPAEGTAELLAFVGNELHSFDASGRSNELLHFTGEGTEAVRVGDESFSPNLIAAAGDFILTTGSWYAPTHGSSQEAALLHRTEGVVWRRVYENDDAIYGAVVDADGFVFGNRHAMGRPADGIWIGPEGSEGPLPGSVVGVPHANQTVLLRNCRAGLGCTESWWRDGSSWDALPNFSGRHRMGDEVLRVITSDRQWELWLEGPETRRQLRITEAFRTFEIVSFDPSGWALLHLDQTTAPGRFLRVNLSTGVVDPIDEWTGEPLSALARSPLTLTPLGAVSALFRQDGGLILARNTVGAGWSAVGDPLPTDYDVVHFGLLRGDAVLVAHQIPAQFNHVTDLMNAATGARFEAKSVAVAPTQLTQNGLCFARWNDSEDGATLEVLSLATGDALSLAAGGTSQVFWLED